MDRPDNIAFPNGQVVNYGWEDKIGDFRLKEIRNVGASSTALSKFNYLTDAVSRITQWKQQRGATAAERYDLGYNNVDELTSAVLKTDSTGATVKQNYYRYDAAGNRTSEQIDSTVKTATFNNLNQLTATSGGGSTRFKGKLNEPGTATVGGQAAWISSGTNFQADVSLATGTNTVAVIAKDANNNTRTNSYRVVIPSGGSTSVTYDANGNMLSDGTKTYGWDAANRLVKTTYSGGASTEYSYDALGRRVKIVEKASGGSVTSTKQFVFDGMEEAEQRDGSNAVTKRYYVDGWRDVTGGASYFYTKDHLGSVREVTDGSGAMVARYDYDPYGRTTKVSGTVDSDMLYTGHYYDVPSGLYFTMYRAYNPNLARWLSRDPIGEAGGFGLYMYVSNNPINLYDPYGMWPEIMGMDLGNPDVRGGFGEGFGEGLSQGAAATLDGINPFGDPLADMGAYDPCDSSMQFSQSAGAFARDMYGGRLLAGMSWVGNARMGWKGGELTFTRPGAATADLRINPFGGSGRPPHYHRRPGIGKHRPWEGGW